MVAAREVVAAAIAWLKVTDGMSFTEALDEAAGATLSWMMELPERGMLLDTAGMDALTWLTSLPLVVTAEVAETANEEEMTCETDVRRESVADAVPVARTLVLFSEAVAVADDNAAESVADVAESVPDKAVDETGLAKVVAMGSTMPKLTLVKAPSESAPVSVTDGTAAVPVRELVAPAVTVTVPTVTVTVTTDAVPVAVPVAAFEPDNKELTPVPDAVAVATELTALSREDAVEKLTTESVRAIDDVAASVWRARRRIVDEAGIAEVAALRMIVDEGAALEEVATMLFTPVLTLALETQSMLVEVESVVPFAPLPVIPPLAPVAAMRAAASASVSHVMDVPCLLTRGRAKHCDPPEQPVTDHDPPTH